MFLGLWICIPIRIWIRYSHVNTDPNPTPDPSIIKENLDFFFYTVLWLLPVFRIRIGIRIHMFLAILDPDLIVKGMDPMIPSRINPLPDGPRSNRP